MSTSRDSGWARCCPQDLGSTEPEASARRIRCVCHSRRILADVSGGGMIVGWNKLRADPAIRTGVDSRLPELRGACSNLRPKIKSSLTRRVTRSELARVALPHRPEFGEQSNAGRRLCTTHSATFRKSPASTRAGELSASRTSRIFPSRRAFARLSTRRSFSVSGTSRSLVWRLRFTPEPTTRDSSTRSASSTTRSVTSGSSAVTLDSAKSSIITVPKFCWFQRCCTTSGTGRSVILSKICRCRSCRLTKPTPPSTSAPNANSRRF